jgi:hypothetical protein
MSFSFAENQLPFVTTTLPPPMSTTTDLKTFKEFLYRGSNPESVESMCRQLIKKYTSSNDLISLYHLHGVIRETREQMLERDLTYIQLYVWNEEHPIWAVTALADCVYNYGCWKDIKYLCEYCKNKCGRTDHPFILYAICLLDQRLKEDWASLEGTPPQPLCVSYAAKWTPREKSKYGWIYTILAVGYFGYMTSSLSLKQQEGALNKSKMMLRKILSKLNKHLDTLEIKLCKNYWDYINPAKIPVYASFKYHRSLYRHGIDTLSTAEESRDYPYSNIKKLADSLNKEYQLDEEVEQETQKKNPLVKTSKEYRQNFDELVSNFFKIENGKGKALSIIDVSTLNKEDINTAIGWTAVECDGAMILNPNGKYQFVPFSLQTFCERIQELSNKISTSTSTATTTANAIPLKALCLFMEKCFNETLMDESERTRIKFFVFCRHPMAELEDIRKKVVFDLKLQG